MDLDGDGLAATVERAPTMRSWECDVTDADGVERLVKEVESALGPIDRLVHAAGICLPGLLTEQPIDEIDRTIAVNYLGTAHTVMAVLPGMLDRRHGEVVAFASLAGWLPSPHLGAYSASKHAVVAFMEVLAYENRGSGVRFACVCPPVVDTPMVAGIHARDDAALAGRARHRAGRRPRRDRALARSRGAVRPPRERYEGGVACPPFRARAHLASDRARNQSSRLIA